MSEQWRIGARQPGLASDSWPIYSGPDDVFTAQVATAYGEDHARLIAAAPKILAALKIAKNALDVYAGDLGNGGAALHALDIVDPIIAKAEADHD